MHALAHKKTTVKNTKPVLTHTHLHLPLSTCKHARRHTQWAGVGSEVGSLASVQLPNIEKPLLRDL